MATRKQIAERILRILQGGEVTADSDIDIREIMLHVDSERDNIIQSKLVQAYKGRGQLSTSAIAGQSILGTYISEQQISTSNDSSRDQDYAQLKQYPLDLPDETGILYVRDADDLNTSFPKLMAGTEAIYASLPSFSASKKTYHSVVGNRIYFSNNNSPAKVLVGLVAKSSSITDTSAYPLSPGDESTIIKSVLDLYNLMNTVKQDFINDNIDQ